MTERTMNLKASNSAVAYILKKLADNNWDTTIFAHNCGATFTVTPCSYVNIKKAEDVDFYLLDCNLYTTWGSDKIEKVACEIEHADVFMAEMEEEQKELQSFYNQHIKGSSVADITLGNEISSILYDAWRPLDCSWDEFYPDYREILKTEAEKRGVEEDYLEYCADLSENFSHYSDWYKSVNGRRPHPWHNSEVAR